MKIISGGQTGADQAALDAAISLGLPHGGWLPKGRKTESGPLPDTYKLKELPSTNYRIRTEKNIVESDGTLIISFGPLTGGSALTEAFAIRHHRPCLHLDMEHLNSKQAVEILCRWFKKNKDIQILNVAGSRASGEPRIYETVFQILTAVPWQNHAL